MPCYDMKKASSENQLFEKYGAPKDSMYYCDFGWMADLQVRKPYEKYGAIAYFDKDKNVTGIYVNCLNKLVLKQEDSDENNEWKWAKLVFTTSTGVGVTVKHHLLNTHLIESNALGIQRCPFFFLLYFSLL